MAEGGLVPVSLRRACLGGAMANRLSFLDKAPDVILKDIIDYWQSIAGRVLYPSQIENLEMHTLAYRESLSRHDIQHSAEQNLVEYAIGEHLDALGAMLACHRLQPTVAECRVKFTRTGDVPADLPARTIAAGTRLTTADGKIAFETTLPAYFISNHKESTEVMARCTETGKDGNGLDAGILCALDPAEEGVEASNVTATEGGAGLETDGAYRERMLLAPASLGCGGTVSGYRYWARSASPLVVDAWPMRGEKPGDINVYVLCEDGLPSEPMLFKVQEVCNSADVRIINDSVTALQAIPQRYRIEAEITIFDNCDADVAIVQAKMLAHEYARKQRMKLGQNVTPTQILMALSPVGERLYHVNLREPKEIIEIGECSFPEAMQINITLAGVSRA
jgi:phage-related baseplate assembly protein